MPPLADEVREILVRGEIKYALIGAAAVSYHGLARSTQDTDFFTIDRRVFQTSLWDELMLRGTPVEINKGDYDDPLDGVVRIGPRHEQVDVIVGRSSWEREIIERATPVDAYGGSTPVATASDLILLKLAAGGYKDLIDAHGILARGSRDALIAEVNANIHKLPKDAQREWAKLIAHPR